MKFFLKLVFILLYLQTYSQTVNELEYELRILRSGEKEGDKIKLARQLQDKEPFNEIAIDYIFEYYSDRDIDSVNVFFDKLTQTFPKNAEPYLLKSRFIHYLNVEYSQKKEFLNKALEIEPNNIEATYNLAEAYYRSFIFPTEVDRDANLYNDTSLGTEFSAAMKEQDKEIEKRKEEEKAFQKDYAEKALDYFEKLWIINPNSRGIIYFPIKQLECFLKIDSADKYNLPENKNSFFPAGHFINKNQNWECDFTINYLFESESSDSSSEYITEQLQGLGESSLFQKRITDKTQIYRYTALPSFNYPICLTLEKSTKTAKLSWNIGKGAGGYSPQGIKESGHKNLTSNEWSNFLQLFENINYSNLPNKKYFLMTDGTTWVLEYKNSSVYEAKETNIPDKVYRESFLYLIKLAKIKLEREDAY